MPAPSPAWRAGACPTPAAATLPMITCPTASGGTPARATAARSAAAPSSGGSDRRGQRPAPRLGPWRRPPLAQRTTQRAGVDPEDVADRLEREEPAPVGRADPVVHLGERLAPAAGAGTRVREIARDRVLEISEHEEPLALESKVPAEDPGELHREEHIVLGMIGPGRIGRRNPLKVHQ